MAAFAAACFAALSALSALSASLAGTTAAPGTSAEGATPGGGVSMARGSASAAAAAESVTGGMAAGPKRSPTPPRPGAVGAPFFLSPGDVLRPAPGALLRGTCPSTDINPLASEAAAAPIPDRAGPAPVERRCGLGGGGT